MNPWKMSSNWTAQDEIALDAKRKIAVQRQEQWDATHPRVDDEDEDEEEEGYETPQQMGWVDRQGRP
jgi:hypothetical protein